MTIISGFTALTVAGIMTALKNEIIFTDCLTGLYNRVYLEFLHKRACNKKDCWVSGIMIDLNGFKQINDNYGHAEGDLALCIVADLFRESFSEYGVVTRYAGDEFVIMLNTTDDQLIQKIIKFAKKNFVTENEKNDKPYQLSASMGYTITNLTVSTLEQVMRRAVADAELPKAATPHCLRHSFATHLMEQGIERQNIQALLGHRDPKSTEVYLHVSNKSLMGIQSPFDRKEGTGHE